jgi:hypothetical protein
MPVPVTAQALHAAVRLNALVFGWPCFSFRDTVGASRSSTVAAFAYWPANAQLDVVPGTGRSPSAHGEHFMHLPSTGLLLLAGIGIFAPAHAETVNCTNLTSLPVVISTQGVYCLKQDLSTAITSGNAITINANNVTLDCNDFKIGGLAAGSATDTNGIYAGNRHNITVRRCAVRGFHYGFQLIGGAGHLVEDNRADLNTVVGMYLSAHGASVRRNRVSDTGGRPSTSESSGMAIGGNGTSVTDNQVYGVTLTGVGGNGNAIGINIFGVHQEFARNLVVDIVPTGSGLARGFWGLGLSSYRDNMVLGFSATGVGLDGGDPSSFCSGNRIHGYTSSMQACTDAGGNFSN